MSGGRMGWGRLRHREEKAGVDRGAPEKTCSATFGHCGVYANDLRE